MLTENVTGAKNMGSRTGLSNDPVSRAEDSVASQVNVMRSFV
jgi:hypothetical protein